MSVNPPTMEIRRTTPGEAALLARTAERFFRESFSLQNDPRQMDAYCAAAFSEAAQHAELLDPMREAFIVYEAGQVIGFAQICFHSLPRAALTSASAPIELERFYVAGSHHGLGVAQQLMQHCVERARGRAADVIWLGVWQTNSRAIAFYRKCGFEIVGEQPFMLGTEQQQDYIMARVI